MCRWHQPATKYPHSATHITLVLLLITVFSLLFWDVHLFNPLCPPLQNNLSEKAGETICMLCNYFEIFTLDQQNPVQLVLPNVWLNVLPFLFKLFQTIYSKLFSITVCCGDKTMTLHYYIIKHTKPRTTTLKSTGVVSELTSHYSGTPAVYSTNSSFSISPNIAI